MSILFVDLVGFTPFAEERDPEEVRETLDRYFETARTAVERHGGTIEKFIGDAVMAVWGTPTAHEDDPERAVRAAFDLLDRVPAIGEGIAARGAVVTGEAAVTLGAEGQGMVAGDLVNTASRLQSVAPAGTVLVNETTMRAASAAIAFEPAGAQLLKGKAAPVEAFRALRVVANRGGQNRAESLEAPFVGRDEELRQLKELLHATSRDQRARLVSISGPAGIGKSRLAWELEKYVDGVVETINWHRGRSPAYGEGITFWALGEMVRRRAQLAESDDEATTRERIAATVADFVADPDDRAWVEPALLALLGIEPPPPGGRDALFAAWRIFFERVSQRATTVMLFEDLQWADTGLLDFIDSLLEWSKSRPILVITLSRPELYERRPEWGAGHRLSTALPLEPLADQDMRTLLAGLVPGLPELAVDTILRRADGIPLYAVETVRMLVSEGRLEAVGDAYHPVGSFDNLAVPETLRSLIASRLDGLDAVDRGLLQDGSVLGQRFSVTAVAALAGVPEETIESRFRVLVKRELLDLELDPRSPERGQYGFVQSLIREVAYGTLARRERRSRHLAAARYFEALGDDELAGALASHYLAAFEASAEGAEADAVAAQARIALRGAAERAAALGAHEQALTYLEQALATAREAADRAALQGLAALSANALSRQEEAADYARAAIATLTEMGDEQAAARVSGELARIQIDAGRHADAIETIKATLAGRPVTDEPSAALLAILSRAYMRLNKPVESIEAADQSLLYVEVNNLDGIVAEALINKASALNMLGRRREAAALFGAGLPLAEQAGLIEIQLRAQNNLSVAVIGDDPRRALELVRESLELARKVGQRFILNWQLGSAALYSLGMGADWDRALAGLEETLATAPPGFDRTRADAIRAMYRVYRGVPIGTLIADGERDVEQQIVAIIGWARAEEALFAGRFDESWRLAVAAAGGWADYSAVILPTAIRAALWSGDLARAVEAKEALDAYPGGALWERSLRTWATAGIAALQNRAAESIAGFNEAIDSFRSVGFDFHMARAMYDAIKLLPDAPERRRWAPEAREVFERVGAGPHLALLDAEVVPTVHTAATPAAADEAVVNG